ncbi:unnamed protein product [Moneuplotes crassus]|uniref:EF-hand domain-containing protein n=1 Tax=Euplotes crassus TaxID=5936 RepID=A0AAD1U4K7_EUPCR|nr:unnamed protein product [Moneuplotes crassus]
MPLGLKTRQLLAELFSAIAEAEIDVENERLELGDRATFIPLQIFKKMDKFNSGEIQSTNLVEYLEGNGLACTQREAELIISQFDETGNHKLSYEEFLQFVLPTTNERLRAMVLERTIPVEQGREREIYPAIEERITKLFSKEIEFQKITERIKVDLQDMYDFSLKQAFDLIDKTPLQGFINRKEIRNFVEDHVKFLSEAELDAIIRRCDTDADQVISYIEFSELIRGIRPELTPQKPFKRKIEQRSYTPLVKGSYPAASSYHSTQKPAYEGSRVSTHHNSVREPIQAYYSESKPTLKAMPRNISPNRMDAPTDCYSHSLRNFSAQKSHSKLSCNVDTQPRDYPTHTPHFSVKEEIKEFSPTRYSSERFKPVKASPSRVIRTRTYNNHGHVESHTTVDRVRTSPMKGCEEEEFVFTLQELIKQEDQLEKSKQALAHRRDFTLNDAFKIFDLEFIGKVSTPDIKEVFDKYGIFISIEDAKLIMSRFDRNRDELLTFEEFIDLFLPIDSVFSKSLDSRSRKHPTGYYKFPEIEDPITRSNFAQVLRLTMDVERRVESIRQRNSFRPLFDRAEAFQAINSTGSFITREDFSHLLSKHRFYATEKQLDFLMDRFDKNKDRKVTYGEFMEEITPHSPHKY